MRYTGYRSLVTGKYYDLNGNESTRYKLSKNAGMILWEDFYADTDSENGKNVLVLRQNTFGGIERVLNGVGLAGTRREADNGSFSNEIEDDYDDDDTFFDRFSPKEAFDKTIQAIKARINKRIEVQSKNNPQTNTPENVQSQEQQADEIIEGIKTIILNYVNSIKQNNVTIDKDKFVYDIKQQILKAYPNILNNSHE